MRDLGEILAVQIRHDNSGSSPNWSLKKVFAQFLYWVCLFVCLCFWLSICLFVCVLVCLSICLFLVCLFVYLFVCLFVCLFVMFVCMFVYLFVCLCVCCLSICFCLSVCLSVCLFVCLSVCLSVCLFVYLWVCLFVCVCLHVCLSLSLFLYSFDRTRACLTLSTALLQLSVLDVCRMLSYEFPCQSWLSNKLPGCSSSITLTQYKKSLRNVETQTPLPHTFPAEHDTTTNTHSHHKVLDVPINAVREERSTNMQQTFSPRPPTAKRRQKQQRGKFSILNCETIRKQESKSSVTDRKPTETITSTPRQMIPTEHQESGDIND